ncbi:MAG: hypothetical protein M3Y59_10635 [Myxococcota bacterium]|nr:hypothetical protein [Myxococcota bacterium]
MFAAIAGASLWASSARAQAQCPGGGQNSVASCGGDSCSCASPCTSVSECNSGCCVQGFCALRCACEEDAGVVIERPCVPPEDLPAGTGCSSAALPSAGLVAVVAGISRRRQKDHKLLQ